MPISRDQFESTVGVQSLSNKDLLKRMANDQAYSTKDVQAMLGGISHGATLQRLKRLVEKEYLEQKKIKRSTYFRKVKDWIEPEPKVEEE